MLIVADLLNSLFDIYWLYFDLVTQFGQLVHVTFNDAAANVAT